MTKDQQFNQEDRQLTNAMDNHAASKAKLFEDNKILLKALEEIAVPYPENNNADSAEILCKYFIALAQDAIYKIQLNNQ